ncbi:MAG: T9SS type A sorting domain-containing protein, partial [Cytophagales bacterium]|nr:T9SS type A sorting domain-containing protein [Cytophagales bacterium]
NVTLHFNETYWGNLVTGGTGSRKFNVDVEGARKLTEYDIFAKAGAMRAVTETFRTTVSDGVLTILFSKGSADFARVSAIEVVPAIYYEARVAATGTEGARVPILYPNPARDRLYVKLAAPAAGISATAVTTAAGQTVLLNPHRVTGEHELEIRVDGLKRGLYLLRLQSGQGRQVVRFTKQ